MRAVLSNASRKPARTCSPRNHTSLQDLNPCGHAPPAALEVGPRLGGSSRPCRAWGLSDSQSCAWSLIFCPCPASPRNYLPAVARRFAEDMRAYHATKDSKRDEIAPRQTWLLNEHFGPREKKLRLIDVRATFLQMREEL